MQYISEVNNVVADARSRLTSLNILHGIDLPKLAPLQKEYTDIQHELSFPTLEQCIKQRGQVVKLCNMAHSLVGTL